jgi:hypothetical protein
VLVGTRDGRDYRRATQRTGGPTIDNVKRHRLALSPMSPACSCWGLEDIKLNNECLFRQLSHSSNAIETSDNNTNIAINWPALHDKR